MSLQTDSNIPLPANYFDLPADGCKNYGTQQAARARERGEETQDTELGTD